AGCARTDAGVHANEYYCNFKTEKEIPLQKIPYALNANLPYDIAVLSCAEAQPDFNARFSCKSREYIYKIWNSEFRNPFLHKKALHYRYHLDAELLDSEARAFLGIHDFFAFQSVGTEVKTTVRMVKKAAVERAGDMVIFTVEADGFLYNMVRIMTGTLLSASEGKIEKGKIPEIILSKDREKAGFTAPAEGLYLNRVEY
ncbi:MAG: tRNA pseudouridine(38-40) synthase TruA, partial [Oscillospiraceae bacterium]|nr:tRNA pseudouridine(38-40) synthase TruA [Oscillospiraceae bacterium]